MVATLILTLTVPLIAEDEIELGLSMMPLHMLTEEDVGPADGMEPVPDNPDMMNQDEPDFMDEWLIGFHFGYSTGILYASLDSFVMPPFLVEKMTMSDFYDEEYQEWVMNPGIMRPGFLSFIDVGAKFSFGQIVAFAEAGVNNLYVYHQGDLPVEQQDKIGKLGTNLRIGASYKVIDNLSVGITGTAIFPNFKTMGSALKGLFGDDNYANSKEQLQVLPMIMAVFYL
jgi:hypothetical protein